LEVDAWESSVSAFLVGRDRVQVSEVAREALFIETAKLGTREQRRITSILSRLKWTAGKSNGVRFYQRARGTQ